MSNFAAVGSTAYSGSKAAIQQMGKVMANELGGEGITVNTIQPGRMSHRPHSHLDAPYFMLYGESPVKHSRDASKRLCGRWPGWMSTLGERLATGHDGDYSSTGEDSTLPARRVGTPEDIGASVAFLCSDEAFYVNGPRRRGAVKRS
jgi:NAD(P)-dependent dehydrogenase (short-subunit alcohol dehydrogenase family)